MNLNIKKTVRAVCSLYVVVSITFGSMPEGPRRALRSKKIEKNGYADYDFADNVDYADSADNTGQF